MSKIPPNREAEAFFDKHCAKPGHVVIAENIGGSDDGSTGVFSSFAKAIEWAEQFEDGSTVFGPYVIDFPDFGNVPPAQIN